MEGRKNSWKLWQICPCCAIELELIKWVNAIRCNNAIEIELKVIKSPLNRKVKIKPKRKIWIEYHPEATDRSVLY